MRAWFAAAVTVALMMTMTTVAFGQARVGAVRPYASESPHPYPAGQGGSATVWREIVHSPGATFLRLHFEDLELGPGDALTVSSPDDSQVWRVTGRGRRGTGDAWSFVIDGDTAIVRIHGGASPAFGYRLTEIVHGTAEPFGRLESRPESVCGSDNREPIACYEDDPGVAATQRPVARLVYQSGGEAFACTGVLVRGAVDSLLLTNNHCLLAQAEVDTLQATFGFQRTACTGGEIAAGVPYAGELLVTTSAALDYSLVTLHGNPEAVWGEVTPTADDADVDSEFWLIQHPGSGPKQIAYWDDAEQTTRCHVEQRGVTIEPYTPGTQMEYTCDTAEGSSGSPLISAQTNQLVGLHHLGRPPAPMPCLNAATMMGPICQDAGSLLGCDSTTASYRRYLAEGAEGFFQTFVGVFNPSASDSAFVSIEALADDGTVERSSFSLGPRRNTVVRLAELVGNRAASTVVTSNVPLVTDRYMQWGQPLYGSSMERAVPELSDRWWFGEGATGPFQLFYLLENPWAEATDVTISYLREGGSPVERTYRVAGRSRSTVYANAEPGLATANVSAEITSTRPIVAERSMYLDSGLTFRSGTAGAGATSLSPTWYFAEGATGFFDEFLLLGNLGEAPIDVTAEYLLPGGRVIEKTYAVGGQTRRTVWVNGEDPQLANTAVAVHLSATAPFIAERAMWWPHGEIWRDGHVSLGSTETGTVWAVAYAGENCRAAEDTFALISNAASAPGRVRVTAYFTTGGSTTRELEVASQARLTVSAAQHLGIECGAPFSLLVESIGADPVPIAVEVSRYFSATLPIEAGGAALATKVR